MHWVLFLSVCVSLDQIYSWNSVESEILSSHSFFINHLQIVFLGHNSMLVLHLESYNEGIFFFLVYFIFVKWCLCILGRLLTKTAFLCPRSFSPPSLSFYRQTHTNPSALSSVVSFIYVLLLYSYYCLLLFSFRYYLLISHHERWGFRSLRPVSTNRYTSYLPRVVMIA